MPTVHNTSRRFLRRHGIRPPRTLSRPPRPHLVCLVRRAASAADATSLKNDSSSPITNGNMEVVPSGSSSSLDNELMSEHFNIDSANNRSEARRQKDTPQDRVVGREGHHGDERAMRDNDISPAIGDAVQIMDGSPNDNFARKNDNDHNKLSIAKKRKRKASTSLEVSSSKSVIDNGANDDKDDDGDRSHRKSNISPMSVMDVPHDDNSLSIADIVKRRKVSGTGSVSDTVSIAPNEVKQNSGQVQQNTGRWTDEEHRLFLQGLEQHGEGTEAYPVIADLVRTRTAQQVRIHAMRHFERLAREHDDEKQSNSNSVKTKQPAILHTGTTTAPCPEIGIGWIVQSKPRKVTKKSCGIHVDRYYFSPKGERFRSMAEVHRHLASMNNEEAEEEDIVVEQQKKRSSRSSERRRVSRNNSPEKKRSTSVSTDTIPQPAIASQEDGGYEPFVVELDGSQISMEVRPGMTLLDARQEFLGDQDFFFQVDGSIISKKAENGHCIDTIVMDDLPVKLISRLALEQEVSNAEEEESMVGQEESTRETCNSVEASDIEEEELVEEDISIEEEGLMGERYVDEARRSIITDRLLHRKQLLAFVQICRESAEKESRRVSKANNGQSSPTLCLTSDQTRNTGPWTDGEHHLFLQGLELNGKGKWTDIAALVQTRNANQVIYHAGVHFQQIMAKADTEANKCSPMGSAGDDEKECCRVSEANTAGTTMPASINSRVQGLLHLPNGRWQLRIGYRGKQRWFGVFSNQELAALANEVARNQLGMTEGLDLNEEEIDEQVSLARIAVVDAVSKMSKPNGSYTYEMSPQEQDEIAQSEPIISSNTDAQLEAILRLGPFDDGPKLISGRFQQQEGFNMWLADKKRTWRQIRSAHSQQIMANTQADTESNKGSHEHISPRTVASPAGNNNTVLPYNEHSAPSLYGGGGYGDHYAADGGGKSHIPPMTKGYHHQQHQGGPHPIDMSPQKDETACLNQMQHQPIQQQQQQQVSSNWHPRPISSRGGHHHSYHREHKVSHNRSQYNYHPYARPAGNPAVSQGYSEHNCASSLYGGGGVYGDYYSAADGSSDNKPYIMPPTMTQGYHHHHHQHHPHQQQRRGHLQYLSGHTTPHQDHHHHHHHHQTYHQPLQHRGASGVRSPAAPESTIERNKFPSSGDIGGQREMTFRDGQMLIAQVKQAFGRSRSHVYEEFVNTLTRVEGNEVATAEWARHVMRLLKGHNRLILGLFSFLPDSNEHENSSMVPTNSEHANAILEADTTRASVKGRMVSTMLVERMSCALEQCEGQVSLKSILRRIHEDDASMVSYFPTVDTLRSTMLACYQTIENNKTTGRKNNMKPRDPKRHTSVTFDEMKRLMRVYGPIKALRNRSATDADKAPAKRESIRRKFYRWFPDFSDRFVKTHAGYFTPKVGHLQEMQYREDMRKKDQELLVKKRNDKRYNPMMWQSVQTWSSPR